MQTGLAEQRQLTIIEGRVDDAPHALVIDDGEKYAVAIDPVRLQAVFAADNGLAPIIDAIELKAQETSPDVRTVKGRADIRALAHKVTRSKTYLDGLGKDIVAELKELPKRIDANRKILRDRLDILAEETRQSLTDYEARIDGHKSRMQTIRDTPMIYREQDAEDITRVINELHAIPMTAESSEEFLPDAIAAQKQALDVLEEMYTTKLKAEAEAEELARLRKEAADREEADREAARIAEAEERGRKDAEAAAERDRQAALGREAEANRQAELSRQQAEEAERRRVESEANAAQAALDARLKAEQARQDGIEAERKRAENEATQAAAAQIAREADQNHRKEVNGEVAADISTAIGQFFKLAERSPDDIEADNLMARAINIAIIKGQVRHTAITY
jgi:chromosome segregation ATPase